ncbi:15438_t:CDS:2 [Entrophospora sp. SA101]|nr:15438_t:CDS:2 [Entrophospora sp. SA101]
MHKGTSAFLHSHTECYPLHYGGGCVSSKGQQMTEHIGTQSYLLTHDVATRFNDTLFQVFTKDGDKESAFGQQEVNDNKKNTDKINYWFVYEIVSLNDSDTREQIYLIGNPVGWWVVIGLIAVLVGVLAADMLSCKSYSKV